MNRPIRYAVPLAMAAVVAGCASLSPDGGLSPVASLVRAELGHEPSKVATPSELAAARSQVTALLARPLNPDSAVRIALLNNRGLQAAYNDLGISEAAYVEASLPPAPRLSVTRTVGALELEIERQIVGSLLALVTLSARADIARDRFAAAQLRAAEATLRLAADTRRQYFRAVAAGELVAILGQLRASANTTSDLARRLGETGALSKLDQAREHALTAEISAQYAKAQLAARSEREGLTRLLGLWGAEIAYTLPGTLPRLPPPPPANAGVEAQAVARRVDLEIARIELGALGKTLGLTGATRLIDEADLVGTSRRVTAGAERSTQRGLGIELTLPVFDFGGTRVAEAEQRYFQAANRLAERAVNARSEAREAYQAYRGSYDIAQLYERQVLPLRRIIQEQSQLNYNGMITDVSKLVADARAAFASNMQAVEARRDFWIAETELRLALTVGGSARTAGASVDAGIATAGASQGHGE